MKRPITTRATLIVLALASGQVLALGFGRVVSDTVLGQPLSFTVPVRVEPGERFGEDCVRTLVFFGEGQLPPNQVRTLVERDAGEGQWRVRVTTTGPVNEPVVDVSVEAGCGRPFARRFTVFADPPAVPWSAQLARADAAPAAPEDSTSAAAAPAPLPSHSRSPRPVVRKGPTVALAASSAAGSGASKRRGPVAVPTQARTAPSIAGSRLQVADPGPRLELSAGFGGPRLRMDIDDPEIPAQDAAAQAALTQQVEGDTQQLENLQRNIAVLRRESQTGLARTAQLQAALDEAESRNGWLPWLAGLFGITLAVALLLAWRLRRQSRLAHSRWYEESALLAASAEAPASAPAEIALEPAAPMSRPVPATTAAEAPPGFGEAGGALVQDVAVMPSAHVGDGAEVSAMPAPSLPPAPAPVAALPEQDVSVEELLDIEQQADFFVALGQEDAAVDLLTAHVRATGEHSPLPYAKLLEIHRRLDDLESYERVRERFQRRFGVEAPEWSVGPTSGRALEDYADCVTRLQIVWKAPADAMVLLHALLFRRDESDELFELPAYRDMLLLYSIARDLVQHPPQPLPEVVDVFLPIDDGASAAAGSVRAGSDDVEGRDATVAPTSYEMPEFQPSGRASEFGEVHATLELSPLDLDVSDPGEAPAGAGARDATASSGARARR